MPFSGSFAGLSEERTTKHSDPIDDTPAGMGRRIVNGVDPAKNNKLSQKMGIQKLSMLYSDLIKILYLEG